MANDSDLLLQSKEFYNFLIAVDNFIFLKKFFIFNVPDFVYVRNL